jgi:hypothetical protein
MRAKELRAKLVEVKHQFTFYVEKESVINISYSNCGSKARISTNNSEIFEAIKRKGIAGIEFKQDDFYIITTPIEL